MNTQQGRFGWLEWVAAMVLLGLYLYMTFPPYGNWSAQAAHERSERTYHYGPSEVVRTIRLDDTVIFLGTYQNAWFSANTVIKNGLFWYPGSGVNGIVIDEKEALSYGWNVSQINKDMRLAKWYGYVNDPNINKVELWVEEVKEQSETRSSQVLEQAIGEERMFLFHWNDLTDPVKVKLLRGLDRTGAIVYEHEFY